MMNKNNRPGKGRAKEIKREDDYDQRVIDVARVTRVMKGGKRMKFRVCIVIGDKKGKVGYGIAKGADVTNAISKSVAKAKKQIISVPITDETIPHEINMKFKAAKVILKPAKKGSGVKAGGAVRIICELAGIPNITGKILGTNNKINNVKAVFEAFSSFKKDNKKKTENKEKIKKEEKPKKK